PMVAGVAASLQGIAKMFFGIPLMPEQIRAVLSSAGQLQCAFFNIADIPGDHAPIVQSILGAGCDTISFFDSFADWDRGVPANRIGNQPPRPIVFTAPYFAAIELVTGEWFDNSGLIDDVIILRGTKIVGNVFSIKASDDNYLVVESQFTKAGLGSHPQLPAPVNYPVFGQYADIVVIAHADAPGVNAMVVSVEARVTGSGTPGGILFVELFDWQQNFWTFSGVRLLGFGATLCLELLPDECFQFEVGSASRFVRPSDHRVFIRVWTLGLAGIGGGIGGGGANRAKIRMFYDLIRLQVGADFADIDP
ncbi:MAG: hypothetical protein IH888_09550, partial [Planctomycetes bacterium]|nr:hypothetical protein [Planctomycetota bacterium]